MRQSGELGGGLRNLAVVHYLAWNGGKWVDTFPSSILQAAQATILALGKRDGNIGRDGERAFGNSVALEAFGKAVAPSAGGADKQRCLT